ncbi:hypothetical protein ACJX0J_034487, partial [Zea mays]
IQNYRITIMYPYPRASLQLGPATIAALATGGKKLVFFLLHSLKIERTVIFNRLLSSLIFPFDIKETNILFWKLITCTPSELYIVLYYYYYSLVVLILKINPCFFFLIDTVILFFYNVLYVFFTLYKTMYTVRTDQYFPFYLLEYQYIILINSASIWAHLDIISLHLKQYTDFFIFDIQI